MELFKNQNKRNEIQLTLNLISAFHELSIYVKIPKGSLHI